MASTGKAERNAVVGGLISFVTFQELIIFK
jgi:hypothetical protein